MRLSLKKDEIQIVQAALSAVMPSGGGGAIHNVYMRILKQTKVNGENERACEYQANVLRATADQVQGY